MKRVDVNAIDVNAMLMPMTAWHQQRDNIIYFDSA